MHTEQSGEFQVIPFLGLITTAVLGCALNRAACASKPPQAHYKIFNPSYYGSLTTLKSLRERFFVSTDYMQVGPKVSSFEGVTNREYANYNRCSTRRSSPD